LRDRVQIGIGNRAIQTDEICHDEPFRIVPQRIERLDKTARSTGDKADLDGHEEPLAGVCVRSTAVASCKCMRRTTVFTAIRVIFADGLRPRK
jgi:hypothetical protein